MIHLQPIAYFVSSATEKRDVPRQGSLETNTGVLLFLPNKNYEQALQDLAGFDRIWIIFWMHRVSKYAVKVQPPRQTKKKGVFATRSPHRPNPIGLSCVKILSVCGLEVKVESHDLLDGTPILDIKPYLPYADSFPDAKVGWVSEEPLAYTVRWEPFAEKQIAFIQDHGSVELFDKLQRRLKHITPPSSSNRLKFLSDDLYQLAYHSWRLIIEIKNGIVTVKRIFSGYDLDTLQGRKESRWGDCSLHRTFTQCFGQIGEMYSLYPQDCSMV